MKVPRVPPTLLGPQQRAATWPPPKLTTLMWGTAIMRQPNGGVQLCLLAPDGSEGIAVQFDALGWAQFSRDVQQTAPANGGSG